MMEIVPRESAPMEIPTDAFIPVAVITRPLLRIRKHLVCLRDLLELLLGFRISSISVWMMLQGHPAVGFLNLLRRCLLGNLQNLVIISLRHSRLSHLRP